MEINNLGEEKIHYIDVRWRQKDKAKFFFKESVMDHVPFCGVGTTETETGTGTEMVRGEDTVVRGGAEVLQRGKGARNAVPGLNNGIEKERKSNDAHPVFLHFSFYW